MRIVTLVENTASREGLAAEHGLSLYLEAGGQRILFDAGRSAAFWENAEKLGIDLQAVDLAVLSHGHYDHGGGLGRFLQGNSRAPVWMNPHAFGDHYNAAGNYIGLDQTLKDSGRIRFAENGGKIGPGLTLYTAIPCSLPIQPFGLTVRQRNGQIPEDFRHEQYLLVEEGGRRILISGCSHRGVLNILAHFRPDVLVGGFHFMKMDPGGPELEAAARRLRGLNTVYYTGHCTGQDQFDALKKILGPRLHSLTTGSEIVL